MFLRNYTKYPDYEVRRLVHLAAQEFDHRAVCINVKNTNGNFRGRAYCGHIPKWFDCNTHEVRRSNAPKSAKHLVVVAVGAPGKFTDPAKPVTNVWQKDSKGDKVPYGGARSPVIVYRSWQEALVAVVAHELNHIRQYQNKMPMAEYRCEMAAARALERYRATLTTDQTEETNG